VVLTDYFFLRRKSHLEQPFHRQDLYWYSAGFNPWAFVSWGVGFGLYHILQGTTSIGSSIPSLVVAGLIYLFLMALWKPVAKMRPASVAKGKLLSS
jgi:cytosine/uracil/thiamine/allantoin permease